MRFSQKHHRKTNQCSFILDFKSRITQQSDYNCVFCIINHESELNTSHMQEQTRMYAIFLPVYLGIKVNLGFWRVNGQHRISLA